MTMWVWLLIASGCQKAAPVAATAATSESATEDGPPQATSTSKYELADDASPVLRNPKLATATAPNAYDVRLTTSKGDIVLRIQRSWSPHAADRFYNLVEAGYYDQAAFFRTIEGFVAQFGISAYPEVNKAWRDVSIPDDPPILSNTRGRVSFAQRGVPDSRTTQLFINRVDNTSLNRMGFAPFAEVVQGMEVVDALHNTGEGAPRGAGPSQPDLRKHGNALLDARFPEIDRILQATVVPAIPTP